MTFGAKKTILAPLPDEKQISWKWRAKSQLWPGFAERRLVDGGELPCYPPSVSFLLFLRWCLYAICRQRFGQHFRPNISHIFVFVPIKWDDG